MLILQNHSLINYNTFGVEALAKTFIQVESENELKEVLKDLNRAGKFLFIGGGSNILFTHDSYDTLVHLRGGSIEVVSENEEEVIIEAGAGVVWDELVKFAVEHSYFGIENLSSIPGLCGAAPIQNIGAYGVELKDHFEYLNGFFVETLQKRRFTKEEARFGYRDSLFKNDLRGKFVISGIALKLSKRKKFNLTYRALKEELRNFPDENLTIDFVRDTICKIRMSKLPDPAKLGNAGSFFKNPELDTEDFYMLRKKFPDLNYFQTGSKYKIPAGWLIEKCGFKGKRFGNVGCYELQALVIVNYGGADGAEIYRFAEQVKNAVASKFGIQLEYEVNIL